MKRAFAFILSAAVLAAAAPGAATAQSWRDSPYEGRQQDRARAAVEERRVIPLERIIEQINRRTPGQLLGAGPPTQQGGRMIYRILWDSRGRQIEYVVDARSGSILAVNGN